MKHGAFSRLLCLLLPLTLFSCMPAHAADCGAKAMILYEPRTGTVLEEKNADERMLIASTTKIMTALIVLERSDLRERVTVTAGQCAVEGSSMYLRPGEEHSVEELLYGLLLASGNDAAVALAEHTAGSVEAFASLMNEKAAQLGLRNTHFSNPHGLDAPEHFSSARDLALLTANAMQNETFCRMFSAASYSCGGRILRNHNKLLEEYDGCIGGKTGYTRAAGRTLVSCAERDGLRLICVTLSDPNDWADHAAAYDAAFAEYVFSSFPADSWRTLPVISGKVSAVSLRCDTPYLLLRKESEIQTVIELPRFVFAPVRTGDAIGTMTVKVDGKTVLRQDILAAQDAPLDRSMRLMPWARFRGMLARYDDPKAQTVMISRNTLEESA